ncbi:uncharacterized protein LOC122042501 [Zingiber officinale]|uniref:uncharacterized protein LOC122000611 n=1 Tax=Zingiber officinale TaxID=94328 RepID=UPI001C4B363C|nr:uncharacterized protein LOC122000611 [Zingiber officinale]XP_042458623.1 uncharacterized protein LOC122042501 [Zingiber officinale]
MDRRKEEVDCLLREAEEGKEAAEFPDERSLMRQPSGAIGDGATDGSEGGNKRKKKLTKQLSMQETTREARWEKRRRQILEKRQRLVAVEEEEKVAAVEEKEEEGEGKGRRVRSRLRSLTDEDLDELKGCIELGFGFSEEEGGHDLRHTLPALDLYFAVNRLRNCSSSSGFSTDTSSPPALSPRSNDGSSSSGDSWKICNLGDDPLLVKTRLRHWAQAVACSLRQSC